MKLQDDVKAEFERLHDASLLEVVLNWPQATVVLKIRHAEGPRQVTFHQVTRLECPHEYPWGRSQSINEVNFHALATTGRFRVEIEMQSGDTIAIWAGSLQIAADYSTPL